MLEHFTCGLEKFSQKINNLCFFFVSIKRIKRMILNTWKNSWRCKNYIKFNKAKNVDFHAHSTKHKKLHLLIDFVLIILRDDTVPKKFLCRNTKHEIASDLSSYKNNLQIFLSLDIYIFYVMHYEGCFDFFTNFLCCSFLFWNGNQVDFRSWFIDRCEALQWDFY